MAACNLLRNNRNILFSATYRRSRSSDTGAVGRPGRGIGTLHHTLQRIDAQALDKVLGTNQHPSTRGHWNEALVAAYRRKWFGPACEEVCELMLW